MQVGLVACNDYIILESCIYRILKKHFAGKSYYPLLLDFFHEVGYLSCSSLPVVIPSTLYHDLSYVMIGTSPSQLGNGLQCASDCTSTLRLHPSLPYSCLIILGNTSCEYCR